jgi:heme exporter protein D
MDTVIGGLIAIVLQGGPEVVAVLMLFIVLLLFERKRLLSEVAKKDARIDKMTEDYHVSSLTLAEALNSLKMVLFELKSHLG